MVEAHYVVVESFCSWSATTVVKCLQSGIVKLAIGHIHVVLPCLCLCMSDCTMQKYMSSGAKKMYCARGRYAALTFVKQTGLWGLNVLGVVQIAWSAR